MRGMISWDFFGFFITCEVFGIFQNYLGVREGYSRFRDFWDFVWKSLDVLVFLRCSGYLSIFGFFGVSVFLIFLGFHFSVFSF